MECERIEEERKHEYFKKEREAADRKKIRDKIEKRKLKEKQQKDKEKEQHRKDVLKNMVEQEEDWKNYILRRMASTDSNVKKTQELLAKERKDEAIMTLLKRKDREDNVVRIGKIKEYQKDMIMEKIESDNERAEKIKIERSGLLETRQKLRKKIDAQKEKMIEVFNRIKKNGRIGPEDIEEFKKNGFNIDTMRTSNTKSTRSIDLNKESSPAKLKTQTRTLSPRSGIKNSRKKIRYRKSHNKPLKREIITDKFNTFEYVPDKKLTPNLVKQKNEMTEEESIKYVKELKEKLQSELMKELEKEQEKENERNQLIMKVK